MATREVHGDAGLAMATSARARGTDPSRPRDPWGHGDGLAAAFVLIVDDSLTVRMDLKASFESAHFATREAATVAAARMIIEAQLPSVIVLDVHLPDGDGLDFLAELRATERTSQLPVVLLSTEAEIHDRIRGLKRGADQYVGKPYDSEYVVARAGALSRRDAACALAPLRVLVVDDSLTFRESMRAWLSDAGYEVITSASGEEGLRHAAITRPDAIIVDGIMPDMEGATVIRRLRLDPGLAATPCLLLTASEGASNEIAALDAGADSYVRKTDGPEVILLRLTAAIRSSAESSARTRGESALGPKRVLAVDDSPTYLELLSENLRAEGYEVVKARSGEQAMDLLAVEPIDCILLDVVMPGLSGTEVCARIKASVTLRRTPLILLTSLEETEGMLLGINAGADDYVTKSDSFDVLKARLRAQLRRKQFEDDNRRVRDELVRRDVEAEAVRRIAESREALLEQLATKNRELSDSMSELSRVNAEMRMFAHSVSHDLRQPLRSMSSFSQILIDEESERLGTRAGHFLSRIHAGARRLDALIDGLLVLSRVSQRPLKNQAVSMSEVATRIFGRLSECDPERKVETVVQPGIEVQGDPALLENLLENLLGNAWKFTAKNRLARVEFERSADEADGVPVFHIRDNGAGFDMAYSDKLFGPFQRLHPTGEFEGTGIGLATAQRIVHRHGGRIWAQAFPGEGATLFFTLVEAPQGEARAGR
jgi:two-component system NtrC family sensor kinase